MLPLASPQHVAEYNLLGGRGDVQGSISSIPFDSATGMQDGYPNMQSNNQGGISRYETASTPAGQQRNSSVDFETLKSQKLQEFRQALDLEIERKRQKAQQELEDAEREKWKQLMDFQSALQGQLANTNQSPQWHHHHPSINHPMQHNGNAPGFFPQHVMAESTNHGMSDGSGTGYGSSTQQPFSSDFNAGYCMPQPNSFQNPPMTPQPYGYMQQPYQQNARPISPMRPQQEMAKSEGMGIQRPGSPTNRPQQSYQYPSQTQHSNTMKSATGPQYSHQYTRPQSAMYPMKSSTPNYDSDDRWQRESRYDDDDLRQRSSGEQPAVRVHPASPYRDIPSSPVSPIRTTSFMESKQEPPTSPRPPTVREMQEHFEQYRRDREDVWRTRQKPETFTFGYEDSSTFDARPGLSGAMSEGFRRASYLPRKEKLSMNSTWSPSSGADERRLSEAEELEREYAKLTSSTLSPAKANTLMNVKKLQELRRRKLEALTARVVENRRRLAREVKTADRPIEISFVEKVAEDLKVDDAKPNSSQRKASGPSKASNLSKHTSSNSKPTSSSSRPKPSSHPEEIYFDDGADTGKERHSTQAHQRVKRDTSLGHRRRRNGSLSSFDDYLSRSTASRRHLAVLEEIEEPTSAEERSESKEEERSESKEDDRSEPKEVEDPSQATPSTELLEYYIKRKRESRSELLSRYGKESTSQDKESSSEDKDFVVSSPSIEKVKTEKAEAEKSKRKEHGEKKTRSKSGDRKKGKSRSKSRDRKAEKKAKDLVEKLRERRNNAKEAHSTLFMPPTFKRQDVLAAVETGKTSVTLPSRDPKQARQNRKLASAKLVESSKKVEKKQERISTLGPKIATKKSSKPEPRADPEALIERIQRIDPVVQRMDPEETKERIRMDLEEWKEEERECVQEDLPVSKILHDSLHFSPDDEKRFSEMPKSPRHPLSRKETSKRASSGMSVVSDLSESAYGIHSYTGSACGIEEITEDDHAEDSNDAYHQEEVEETKNSDSTISGDIDISGVEEYMRRENAYGDDDDDDDDDEKAEEDREKKRTTIGELHTTSRAEGFEIEEGYDLNSLYSKSAYSKYMEESPDQTDETYSDAMKGLQALEELEKRMDAKERRSVMPELLELTELHQWNMTKVFEHFVRLFPQALQGLNLDALTLLKLMSAPANSIQSPDESDMNDDTDQLQDASCVTPLNPTSPIILTSKRQVAPVSPITDDQNPLSAASSITSGWRERIRSSSSRRSLKNDSSIDMSDLRTSLRSISRRQRRGARRETFRADLSSLDEH